MAEYTTLDQFRGSFKDISRPNRFYVELSGSFIDRFRSADDRYNMPFWCTKAQLPKIDIGGPQIKYLGRTQTLLGDIKEMTTSLTFVNFISKNGTSIRTFFENWMLALINHDNTDDNRMKPSDYLQGNDLIITKTTAYSGGDITTLATYTLHDIVPVSLSEMELDMGTSDSLEDFTIEFKYSSWTTSEIHDPTDDR